MTPVTDLFEWKRQRDLKRVVGALRASGVDVEVGTAGPGGRPTLYVRKQEHRKQAEALCGASGLATVAVYIAEG